MEASVGYKEKLRVKKFLFLFTTDRGWVGWKLSPDRPFIQIDFEFDHLREFHNVHIFTNNQFTRDVSVFKELQIFFSIGGKIFNDEPVVYAPLEDAIFEEPRNVTAKLHRRVAKFVRMHMYFASKWIMISEVSFESSVARGNYTDETKNDSGQSSDVVKSSEGVSGGEEVNVVAQDQVGNSPSLSSSSAGAGDDDDDDDESAAALMPIVIGVLTVVVLCLAAIIFLIVKRTRQKKKWRGVQMNDPAANDILAAEKMALNVNGMGEGGTYPFNGYLMHAATTSSDTGSSANSSSRQHAHLMQTLDDNYNAPFHTPRPARQPGFFPVSRNGSVHSNRGMVTPRGSRKTFPPAPKIQVPPPPGGPPPPPTEEAVYTEPGTYTEPYRALRYSPYYGYGPILSEIEDSLMKQSLLSGRHRSFAR